MVGMLAGVCFGVGVGEGVGVGKGVGVGVGVASASDAYSFAIDTQPVLATIIMMKTANMTKIPKAQSIPL